MDQNLDYSVSNEYHSEEFPLNYRNFLLGDILPQEMFTNECLQKIYQSGKLPGTRLLDFGCGPTVHRIASATRQFNDVVLSEWSVSNRNELKKWLSGDKDALDWTPVMEQCAAAEGYKDLTFGAAEIEERIRKSVKKVVPCDALSKNILPEGLGKFDVINSSFCFESCCPSVDVYKEVLKKLVDYLNNEGALIVATAVEAKRYAPNKVLPALYLTEDTIKDALNEAGMELQDWFFWRLTGNRNLNEYAGISVCYAVKS